MFIYSSTEKLSVDILVSLYFSHSTMNIALSIFSKNILMYICVCVCVCVYAHMLSHFSFIRLFSTLWTVAHQDPLSMGFSRQEYWGGLPYPTPGDLPNPGIKPASVPFPTLAGRFFTPSAT